MRSCCWGPLGVTFLCFVIHARGQDDFNLADALDDPEPTKKPSSDIYPRPKPPPPRPQPGHSDNSGGYFNDGNHDDGRYPPRPRPPADIYPKPKPPFHPQPGNPDSGGTLMGPCLVPGAR
ncbi:PREDICTED: glycoprotein Xg [Hipposideros armiger]|uniref:Glycoprotein Xg n=1 Tax=Hipposideros armiger TaxID=186990 RepID=A0A8B7Q1N0_HIPAR|nr:PREDICTED: glycoprotein Xg [Hipposideros armiger]